LVFLKIAFYLGKKGDFLYSAFIHFMHISAGLGRKASLAFSGNLGKFVFMGMEWNGMEWGKMAWDEMDEREGWVNRIGGGGIRGVL